jgi:hypothetical protein
VGDDQGGDGAERPNGVVRPDRGVGTLGLGAASRGQRVDDEEADAEPADLRSERRCLVGERPTHPPVVEPLTRATEAPCEPIGAVLEVFDAGLPIAVQHLGRLGDDEPAG